MLQFCATVLLTGIFCIAKCEGQYALLDPSCERDQSGNPRKCAITTKSEKCPDIMQYYKEVDKEIVCCCRCAQHYCTNESNDSVICHKEYCPAAPTPSTPVGIIPSTSPAIPNNTTVGLITRILTVTSAVPEPERTAQGDRRDTTDRDIQTEDTPTTPEAKNEETTPESKNDLSTGSIVGIVIGVLVGVVIIGVIVRVLWIRIKGMRSAHCKPAAQDPPHCAPKPEETIPLKAVDDAA